MQSHESTMTCMRWWTYLPPPPTGIPLPHPVRTPARVGKLPPHKGPERQLCHFPHLSIKSASGMRRNSCAGISEGLQSCAGIWEFLSNLWSLPTGPQIMRRNSCAGIFLESQSCAGIWEFLRMHAQDFMLSPLSIKSVTDTPGNSCPGIC